MGGVCCPERGSQTAKLVEVPAEPANTPAQKEPPQEEAKVEDPPKEEPPKVAEPPEEEPPPAAEPAKVEEPPPKAVEEPAAVKSAPISVPVDFLVNGSVQTVMAVKKPFGCVFSPTTPITVKSLRKGSHAEELGVQPGWTLKAVGGEELSELKMEAAMAKMQFAMATLEKDVNSVELVFDANGEQKIVMITRNPLGCKLQDNNGTLTVSEVKAGTHADKLNVQVGWTLKMIAGQDVIKPEYDDKMKALENALKPLPQQEN